jgi:predicted SnoaL-like aldol condensation-catalyzing enzyme
MLEDQQLETDVVVVWRIVDGRIAEVWDIPSVYS